MEPEKNNLEKNIERLVKSVADSHQPSKAFIDSLSEKAIAELGTQKGGRLGQRPDAVMTARKLLAYAASIIVACGLFAGVMMLQNSRQKTHSVATSVSVGESVLPTTRESEISQPPLSSAAQPSAPKPAEIEYVARDVKGVAVVTRPDGVVKDKEAEPFARLGVNEQTKERQVAQRSLQPPADALLVMKAGDKAKALDYVQPRREEMKMAIADSFTVAGEAQAGLVPLQITLPKPMFVGTPASFAGVTNIEKPRQGPRPPFLAPAGVVNVALGKLVTASDSAPIIGSLDLITDGDKEAAEGSCVELAPGLQYVTIDLGAAHDIYAVVLWHYHKMARVYFDVIVQVADDPNFTVNVRTLFNNDIDNSAGQGVGSDLNYIETFEGKLIDAKGVRARYVRLYGKGSSSNDMSNYIEVEVYGQPASDKPQSNLTPVDIKLPKPAFVGTPMSFSAPESRERMLLGDSVSSHLGLARKAGAPCDNLQVMHYPRCAPQQSWRYHPPVCPPMPPLQYPPAHGGTQPPNGEDADAMFFQNYGVNPFIDTEDDHLSTFAIDVDTASYTVARGYLLDGHLPPNDAVRVEEFVNYFKYDYAPPQEDDFAVYAEAAPWPFDSSRKGSCLLRIGLKAREICEEDRRPAILTFVIDVSGSMGREDRLGLVKKALRMLIDQLRPEDKIGIAVYGSRGRILMEHKGLDHKYEILSAIESLSPSGSTYAEEGIRIGYEMAQRAFKHGCINRVILCSDGVANVGQTGAEQILNVIRDKAAAGINLSAIGFGMGNYNDVLMEQLADKGDGQYAYVDTIAEARRIFEQNLTGLLQVVAKDVKIQVDFNGDVVRSFRPIGYENRDVPDEKFRDDKYDGGEVGAGHSVTALYELKLWPDKKGVIATTYVRYKHPQTNAVTEFKSCLDTEDLNKTFAKSTRDFRLAATVVQFAEILRKSYWAKDAALDTVLEQAQKLAADHVSNADVIELVDLISKANQQMKGTQTAAEPTEESETLSRLREDYGRPRPRRAPDIDVGPFLLSGS